MNSKKIKLIVITALIFFSSIAFSKEENSRVLLFFYSSGCEYCHEMADILVRIKDKHGVRVVANSLDGKAIEQFPDALFDNNVTKKFKIISIPTLIAVDIKKRQFEIISIGLELEAILEAKILAWVNNA